MSTIFNVLFGNGWRTSIAGYIIAILTAIVPVLQGKVWTYQDLILPAVIAIIARFVQLHPDSANLVEKDDTPQNPI